MWEAAGNCGGNRRGGASRGNCARGKFHGCGRVFGEGGIGRRPTLLVAKEGEHRWDWRNSGVR